MMLPPWLLLIRWKPREKAGWVLPVPIFLIWPVTLALWLALFPFFLLASVGWWACGKGTASFLMWPRVLVLLCTLSGLSIELPGGKGLDRIVVAFR